MNQFTKTMIAVALMAGAGAANASIVYGQANGSNEAYLVAYDADYAYADGSKGRTFNLDLNISFAAINGSPAAAFAAYAGAGRNLSTDANWSAFVTGIGSNVKYAIVDSSQVDHTAFFTGTTAAPQANLNDPTQTIFDNAGTKIDQHAAEINLGLASGADSSLIKQNPNNHHGQADDAVGGLPFQGVWTGVNYQNLIAYGSAAQFWKGSYQLDYVTDYTGFGAEDVVGTAITTQADITNVGSWLLSGNTLSFTPVSEVPVPAAVWMFGTGLMGLLGAARRKTF